MYYKSSLQFILVVYSVYESYEKCLYNAIRSKCGKEAANFAKKYVAKTITIFITEKDKVNFSVKVQIIKVNFQYQFNDYVKMKY